MTETSSLRAPAPRHSAPGAEPGSSAAPSKSQATDNRRAAPPGPARARRTPHPGWLLAIVLTGQFMAMVDTFIVNVAGPGIQSDLHASGSGLQLVVAGYTIAYAVLLITGARLGGLVGPRRVFLGGLAVFTAASLACGLAGSTGALVGFRLVQGTGAALMLPQVLSLIQRTFTGTSRTRALGAYAGVLGVGAAAGQILGGVLVSADLFGWGWRPVFLLNVPVGVLLLLLGTRLMGDADTAGEVPDRARRQERRELDLSGLVLLGAVVLLFTVPVVLGQEQGWPLWGWVSLSLCALLFAVFVRYETRLARRGGRPLISPLVLRAPGVPIAVVRIGCMMAVNSGVLFVLMLHFQGGLGQSALRAGLSMVPTAVAFAAVGLSWRLLPERWQPGLSLTGFLAAAGAFGWLALLLRDGGDGGVWLVPDLAVLGAGLSLAYNPVLARALAGVRKSEAADASGLLVTTAQLGLLTGVALFGAVFLGQAGAGTGGAGTAGSGAGGGPGDASAHAVTVTCVLLAAGALTGAASGSVSGLLRRARRTERAADPAPTQ